MCGSGSGSSVVATADCSGILSTASIASGRRQGNGPGVEEVDGR